MSHKIFDEEELFERKKHFLGYRYCPRCSSELAREKLDGRDRMKCTNPDCDFIYYHNPIPAAGAIVVKDNRVLMVKRSAPPKIGWWCFPAGFMEWDEHPTETAVRELREETGLDVRLDSLFQIYSGNDDPRMNAVLILYTATQVGGQLKAGDDAQEAKFFEFDNTPENIAFESHIQALADYRKRFL